MKFTGKQIIRLIAQVRAGNPPKPAEGKFEDIYLDPALPNFGIRMLHTGAAIWFVHKKVLGRQHKVTIGDVRVIDRAAATEAARDVLAKIQLRILDPQAAKREAMRTAKVTFESVVPLFLQYKKDKGIRRNTELAWTSYLTQYHFKPLHRQPID